MVVTEYFQGGIVLAERQGATFTPPSMPLEEDPLKPGLLLSSTEDIRGVANYSQAGGRTTGCPLITPGSRRP